MNVGVVVTDHIVLGTVENNRVTDGARTLELGEDAFELLTGMPADDMVALIAGEIAALAGSRTVDAVGLACPGIVRGGLIEDSPNLQQLKGFAMEVALRAALTARGMGGVRVVISNDADAVAAGIAATHDVMDRLIRVWTLGNGIGFGHHPAADGVWEGGHTVVSLDPNEKYCGCGGRGHLEGIMGHRAMRLRFLDLEPEEVFALAKGGPDAEPDPRCAAFVLLWHRALAAAIATSIHLEGGGKFYITGMNARFVNLGLLNQCVQEMVKLSPLQSYFFEVVEKSSEIGVLGAAINAMAARP